MGLRLAMHLLLVLSLVASGLASAVHVAAHPVSGLGEVVRAHDGHAHHDHAGEHLHPPAVDVGDGADADVDGHACLGYHLFSGTYAVSATPPCAPRAEDGGALADAVRPGSAPALRPAPACIRGPPPVS